MANATINDIYSATYSNVPVYELKVTGDHVMRRRSDDWVNATHILKIAGFDKPARTRILEREVQKGVHEKIQGGYGKYQGTWVPLQEGRLLAEKHGVLEKIAAVFDFVPGDKSPPPAPKHTTAASARPKQPPKQPAVPRKMPSNAAVFYQPAENYETGSLQHTGSESRGLTPESASFMADEDFLPMSQASNASRKRKRDVMVEDPPQSADEVAHTFYGDELLDYFMTVGDDPATSNLLPPTPPDNFDVDRPIDGHGNNALHWACAMGDVTITRDLLARGANPAAQNFSDSHTPLMRAVLFTNNYEKKTFPKIVQALQGTITERDSFGATVFHHIAETSRSKLKWSSARYYCEVLINKLQEMGSTFIQALLTSQDTNLDTAALCALRNGCVKVANFLIAHCPEAADIQNLRGESANDFLRMIREKKETLEQPGSSPPRLGESATSRQSRRKRQKVSPDSQDLPWSVYPPLDESDTEKEAVSRAASFVLDKVGPLMDEASAKIADLYDSQMKEKDTEILEARQALNDFEARRKKVRQETFSLMAKAEDASKIPQLRHEYEAALREMESLLEQKEHATLQNEVLQQDQQTDPTAFRYANANPLSQEEIYAALPWAVELHHQQGSRRQLVREISRLMGDAGTSEICGKHRKLVALATGLKEEELDGMSEELLESLQASKGGDGPRTPPGLLAGIGA